MAVHQTTFATGLLKVGGPRGTSVPLWWLVHLVRPRFTGGSRLAHSKAELLARRIWQRIDIPGLKQARGEH